MVCECGEKVDNALGMGDHYRRHITWHQVKSTGSCNNIMVNVFVIVRV